MDWLSQPLNLSWPDLAGVAPSMIRFSAPWFCVEGWRRIVAWSGVRLADVLKPGSGDSPAWAAILAI